MLFRYEIINDVQFPYLCWFCINWISLKSLVPSPTTAFREKVGLRGDLLLLFEVVLLSSLRMEHLSLEDSEKVLTWCLSLMDPRADLLSSVSPPMRTSLPLEAASRDWISCEEGEWAPVEDFLRIEFAANKSCEWFIVKSEINCCLIPLTGGELWLETLALSSWFVLLTKSEILKLD